MGTSAADKIYPLFTFFLKKDHSQNKTELQNPVAAWTPFIKTQSSLYAGLDHDRLYFPWDLGPLAGDGVFHGLQLLQELLPPGQCARLA